MIKSFIKVPDRISFKLILSGALLFLAGMGVVAGGVYWKISSELPGIFASADYKPNIVTQIISVDKATQKEKVIAEFFKERRYVVPYDKIPKRVVQAFVAAEDDQFFSHAGISIVAIMRAAFANLKAGHVVQGGSTITQQVAKSLFLSPERRFLRKIKEAVLAQRLENYLSKEDILYIYLNQIYLGEGAYGVQAAAKVYFRKDVSELELPEIAILAGMPQAPSKFSPLKNPHFAKGRQQYVLRRLFETNAITEQELNTAIAQPVKVYSTVEQDMAGQYYIEHIRRELLKKYQEHGLYEEGLRVYVPGNYKLFETSKNSVREGLREIDKRRGYRGPKEHLKSSEEIETYSKGVEEAILQKKYDHHILLPDGKLEKGYVYSEFKLELVQNEIYDAVVVDVKPQEATVRIGSIDAKLPLENLKWARKISKGPTGTVFGSFPSKSSDVLSKGDVILVKVKEKKAGQSWTVGLEQVPQVEGALVSIDVDTGYVISMQGGYDFSKSEFNRAVQAQRQMGSAFKPVVYAAAIEDGFTPASIIVDSPIVYENEESGKWKPSNYDEKFLGDTPVRLAFIKSLNIPTIKLVEALSVKKVINYARRLGFAGQLNDDYSTALGSGTASLLELTTMYSVFPRLGNKLSPLFFTKILDRTGITLEETKPQPIPSRVATQIFQPKEESAAAAMAQGDSKENEDEEGKATVDQRQRLHLPQYPLEDDENQVMDPRVAYVMTHLMKEVVQRGTGIRANSLGRPTAGKTGTTNDYKDAWFVGFTPNVVTGVWVGFDELESLGSGETGSNAAIPIWLSFMDKAVQPYPADRDFTIPPGLMFAPIDLKTGKRLASNNANSVMEPFILGTEPKEGRANSSGGESVDTENEFLKQDYE